MDEVDCQAQIQHPDTERSFNGIKQEQSLESSVEYGSRCPLKGLAEQEHDGLRNKQRESTIQIKKELETEETEFHLEFGGPQSSPGQGLTDDYNYKRDDRREEVPVTQIMIKIEQESEDSKPDMDQAPRMKPSTSHPESHNKTPSPVRRGSQYRCHICSAEYGDVIQLTKHAKTHRSDKNSKVNSLNVKHSKVRKCTSCHKVLFYSPTKKMQSIDLCEKCINLPASSRQYDQDERVLKKDVSTTANESLSCNVRKPNNKTLLGNDKRKLATQTFICSLCEQIFQNANTLKEHIAQFHKVKKSFNCKVCRKKCPDQPTLDSHVKDVHVVAKPFTCHLCSKSFSRKHNLKEHKAVHSGEKDFACDRCDCKFGYRKALSRHKQKCTVFSQSSTTNSSSSCWHCPDKFTDRSDLTKHIREHHKDRLHVCKLCDAVFTAKSSLTIHYKAHAGDKPYLCDYCGKGFSRGSHLKVHRLLHTGENPFNCEGCSRTFKRKDHLKSHWQNIHADGGKVHQKLWEDEDCRCVCKVGGCGMRFRHRKQLARHRMKTHEQQEK